MSRALTSLSSSAGYISSSVSCSSSMSSLSARSYAQAILRKRAPSEQVSKTPKAPFSVQRSRTSSQFGEPNREAGFKDRRREDFGKRKEETRPVEVRERMDYSTMKEPDPAFKQHLDGLFPGLNFPPELARRILTHASHPAATYGHNGALSFLGRRVLNSYLMLMLSSSSALKPSDDLEDIISRTLSTYVLGEHVGSNWGLGRVMRWTPTVASEKLASPGDKSKMLKSVGLYKVQGDTVSAVLGGIYHQFGGSVAHRVFHTRILPSILLGKKHDGLPDAFHGDARAICNKMGGLQGPLEVSSARASTSQ